jgi:hypothetical protein
VSVTAQTETPIWQLPTLPVCLAVADVLADTDPAGAGSPAVVAVDRCHGDAQVRGQVPDREQCLAHSCLPSNGLPSALIGVTVELYADHPSIPKELDCTDPASDTLTWMRHMRHGAWSHNMQHPGLPLPSSRAGWRRLPRSKRLHSGARHTHGGACTVIGSGA